MKTTFQSLLLLAIIASVAAAADSTVAFLVAKTPVDELGSEARAACALAKKLRSATVIAPAAGGKFVDEKDQTVPLERLQVIWYHQGDSTDQSGPIYDAKTIEALRKYVSDGNAVFLSGAALAMIHTLGVEPINPRRGGPGNDRNPAGLVPVEPKHPVFRGLKFAGNVVQISDAGYPAFSDFHASGGPSKGMLLARTPGGSENPFAEYVLGKGRIIVMGWRLPHYSYTANPHRANLERLTDNILSYLTEEKTWRKVVVKPYSHPAPNRATLDYVPPRISPHALQSLELAIRDLIKTFDELYPRGKDYLNRLIAIKKSYADPTARGGKIDDAMKVKLAKLEKQFNDLRREALLANPLLDFDRILTVKRSETSPRLGLVNNWESNSSLPKTGYDDQIAVLSDFRGEGKITTLFKPEGGRFVGDVDLHWDATRMLFSMPGKNGSWQVYEIEADGAGLRELPLIIQPDVDNYDACYLPSGDILFTSTAPFVGVPCVTGSSHVSNIYLLDAKGSIRRLTFEQDHDWCPTVLNDGRVLYLRWEYSDIPHFVSRILFQMNPDGTEQMEYYGSNSYWPNSLFYARPCPGHPTRFVGIVSGHHDVPRMGELILFDSAKGRHEADGVIQRIPGYGKKVDPIILDGLVRGSWPKFLHPWPLSDKYIIVSAKPTSRSRWGVYLVDVFDNMVLLKETPAYALLEPIPFRKTKTPPIMPNRAQPHRKDALVFMADVYAGRGLDGLPRGTVKKLRLFTYQFAYHGMGGQVNRVGLDGPWDIKRIIGTVPVEADGSAYFRVPANTPISVQPLDSEGKALQLMRSWMTAMPGEVLTCVGCHEGHSRAAPNRAAIASTKAPAEITPWYGPTRGFSFVREVQPVLHAYCVRCHNGRPGADGKLIPDFTARPPVHPKAKSANYNNGTRFTPSYIALRSYVRTSTIESDIHLLTPCEFHADTTKLVQMLKKGHYGVRLSAEAWDRLITWIDLNAPAHGTWREIVGDRKVDHQRERRRAMDKLYADIDEDPEADSGRKPAILKAASPQQLKTENPSSKIRNLQSEVRNRTGWPFDEAEAKRRQKALGAATIAVDLGNGVKMEFVRIPPGEFIMGDPNGCDDERPLARVKIERQFWIGKFEVTNEQFACFDPTHDSRIEHGDFLQFSVQERGYPVNLPRQPVCRVSWVEAAAFCEWLSERSGRRFRLATEAQWEYACRAGTATPLWYGETDADFSELANLADYSLRFVDTFGWGLPSGAVPPWRPAIERVNDGYRVSAPVGSFKPNPWGLHDMHGNVAEWTRSSYKPYPHREDDGRQAGSPSTRRGNEATGASRKVVRGGSWYDRPKRARSAWRLSYPAWQRVYDVGFRVVAVP